KGQVLAVFAADTVNAEVLQAQANVLAAEAQAADARSNAERARSIADTGALSRQQINQMQTAAKATAAQVQAARAVLQIQKTRQGYTRVIAPDDGVISSRTATVGAVVPAGAEMFRLVRKGRLEWRAEVAGKDLPGVKPGLPATITTSAGSTVTGRVRSVSPTLDAAKRVGMVYVDIDNAQQQGALAGMYANGCIELGQMQGLLVPQAALVTRDGFNYVFVVAPDNKVQQRRVETGARSGDMVQVVSGVEAGARIVHDGAGFLTDGDVVRVVAAPAAAASGAVSAPAPAASAASAAVSQP
ncbi:MAG: efflux RND transporter periplasmic adaptor subunit, partial [Brachymonas sp.]|nr:efflux RND transporter periplasmic adaptor subunit [Brachymonas sp.]